MNKIHFHSSDDRCCSGEGPRRFTFDPNEVTCKACQSNDTFVLSREAAAYVRSLEAQR